MEKRDVSGFNFVRRRSETSLHRLKQDHNANFKFNLSPRPVKRSVTFTPRDVSRGSYDVITKVTLPERFKQHRSASSNVNKPLISLAGTMSHAGLTDIVEDSAVTPAEVDWTDRKSDMDRAIHWIKQELLQIREQDRVLVQRFLEVQATLNYLRGNRSCPSLVARSASSLSSSSWLSLDDGCLSAPGDTPVHQRDVMRELRHRAQLNCTDLIMRQSSLDFAAMSPQRSYEPHTVSLMNVHIGRAHSDDGAEYNITVTKPQDSSAESDDDSTYDTLTKSSSAKADASLESSRMDAESVNTQLIEPMCDAADHFAAECMRILDNVHLDDFDDDSNYDTLTKYPKRSSADMKDVDGSACVEPAYDRSACVESAARGSACDAVSDDARNHSVHDARLSRAPDDVSSSSLDHFDADSLDEYYSSSDDDQTFETHL